MSYFTVKYVAFFLPAVIFIYSIMPKKARPFVLLLANFTAFFYVSKFLTAFLLITILSIYFAGIFMQKCNDKRNSLLEKCEESEEKKNIKDLYKKKKRIILLIALFVNIAFLFFFKYLNFFKLNANLLLDLVNSGYKFKIVKILAPIGISFYTLQALSYIIDIYNDKIVADKNPFRVALFMSFFPQIMEGPIARYSDTADALYEGKRATFDSVCLGYQRIFWGCFKKLVIADRVNILVKTVFTGYTALSGTSVLLGVIGYTIMLYAEFSGTMDVVIGSGEIFHVKLPENFRQPFFAKNISEFWTRWHISLGLWFKDYIFYPVSLSKPMKKLMLKFRNLKNKHIGPLVTGAIALFAVWFLNGLWHGAGYTFLFYGLYQFTLILLGNIFEPHVKNTCEKLHINRQNKFYRIMQSVKMTLFAFIGELFFRAETLTDGFSMLGKIFTNFKFSAFTNGEVRSLGLDSSDYLIILISLIVLLVVGLIKERNIRIRESVSKKNIVLRWTLYYLLIFSIIIFGAYGTGYVPVDPIYADF